MKLEENLETIAQQAVVKADENRAFSAYLKSADGAKVDEIVFRLDKAVTPNISCVDCGSCCRIMRPEASYEAMRPFVTDENYEAYKYLQGFKCKNLNGSACEVYLDRPQVCKDFPYTDIPGFTTRTVGIFQNYEMCPIVYNIVDQLKVELGWEYASSTDV